MHQAAQGRYMIWGGKSLRKDPFVEFHADFLRFHLSDAMTTQADLLAQGPGYFLLFSVIRHFSGNSKSAMSTETT